MTEPKDPARLREPGSEASPELRRLFGHAERDLPTTAELARLEAKLGPLLDAPAAAPAPSSAASPLAKIGLAVVGGGALVTGLWLALRSPEPPPEAPKPAETPLVTPTPAPPPPSVHEPAPSVAPAETPAPAPAASPSEKAQPDPGPVKRPSSIPEDQLLERARSALRSSPERALSLTRQHQLEFPNGALSQEREVIAIEALRRLGRTDEAARRTERFERLYPQSVHQRKLDAPQREP